MKPIAFKYNGVILCTSVHEKSSSCIVIILPVLSSELMLSIQSGALQHFTSIYTTQLVGVYIHETVHCYDNNVQSTPVTNNCKCKQVLLI